MIRDIPAIEPRLEETKRISRVLRIVQLVSAQPRIWTRRRLAEKFEVSERMIDKDLQLVRHGLRFDLRKSASGYYFAGDPVTKAVHLSLSEALALGLAAQQARATATVDSATIASALARIEDALPVTVVPYLRQADNAPAVSPFRPVRERDRVLSILEQSRAEGRKVSMTYASASHGGAVSERTVAPYYLLPYERSWMLVALDDLRGDVRMFKVDRIERCELTDDLFEVPDDFDITLYLGSTWGVLRGQAGPLEEVLLRFSAETAAWVRDDVWHPSQETETQPDGGMIMRFHCAVTHELVRWVLSFGAGVRVEEPDHLREHVVAEAKKLVSAIQSGSDT